MSTRQSYYYDGGIHIYHELMDGKEYVQWPDGSEDEISEEAAGALKAALELTGRQQRYEVEHARQCEIMARKRIAEGRATAYDIERYGSEQNREGGES